MGTEFSNKVFVYFVKSPRLAILISSSYHGRKPVCYVAVRKENYQGQLVSAPLILAMNGRDDIILFIIIYFLVDTLITAPTNLSCFDLFFFFRTDKLHRSLRC